MKISTELKRTVLHPIHVALGAQMAPFGGWEMPIRYDGIIKEHEACRRGAVLFDTCHMGEFRVCGSQAAAILDDLLTCDVAPLAVGRCRYSLMCADNGGVLDDLLVCRVSEGDFLIVVNAGTQANDFAWMKAHAGPGATLENVSDRTFKIDIQGPGSPDIMRRLAELPITGLRYYQCAWNRCCGDRVLISRTGYTGEIGFEIYFEQPEAIRRFWHEATALGALPAGLGARDTLRLEMGMPLYGHELAADHNAAESGFTKAVSTSKQFTGAAAVRAGGAERLVCLSVEGRSAARQGDAIMDLAGKETGRVTSGSFAPSLGHAVAMGYLRKEAAIAGSRVRIRTARQALQATIVKPPFHQDGTARKPISDFLT